MKDGKRKIFILGLDGASWDLLNPLMDQGIMPNMQKVIEGGTSGVLQSTIPPYTAPAWVSCVTGVNPGKHGIFGFTVKDNGMPGGRFVDSNSVRVPKLWHYINNAGKTVGLINIPITYPSEPVDGFVVPCFMTPLGKKDYTYPVSIYKDFLLPIEYVINVRIAQIQEFSEKTFFKIVDDIKNCTHKRYEAMKALRKTFEPDFFMSVFTCLDKIQHKFWKYLDHRDPMYTTPAAQKVRPHLISVYQQIDDIIGRILEDIGGNTTLYLVSDHGFGPNRKTFFINKWLDMNGFLRVRKLSLIKYRFLSRYIKKMDYSNRNIDIFNNPIYKFIDADKSVFLGSDPYEQGIYHICKSDHAEYLEHVRKLKQDLKALKDPTTGVHLFDEVYHRNDLYTGKYTDKAPDLIVKMKDYGYSFSSGYPVKNKYLTTVVKPAGSHSPAGIFAAYGRDIVPSKKISASIIDVAPTVLHNMGLPVHKEIDGRVLNEIFTSGFQKEHEINYTDVGPSSKGETGQMTNYSDRDKEEISDRLRDLGYLD